MPAHGQTLQGADPHDDILRMWEYEQADLPPWMHEQFDGRTHLPHGPLARFPVPLEGEVLSARSCAPSDGSPGIWQVTGRCAETEAAAVSFFIEYLPLAGYQVTDLGERTGRRGPFGFFGPERATLLLLRHEVHLGCLRVRRPARSDETTFVVDMVHEAHERARETVDLEALRADPSITWQRRW